jgi:Tfp pilus assembly protein PilF/TolB-like protein
MRLSALLAFLALGVFPADAQRAGAVPPACTPEPGTVDELPALEPGRRPLAVLDFESSSGEQAQHDLAAALGRRVYARLGAVRPREVISRPSRGGGGVAALNSPSGADVRYLLEGRLEPGTAVATLTIRLLDGRTGSEVWSGRFGRGRQRLFELEGAISAAIASRTLRNLSREEMQQLTQPPTHDPDAYQKFLTAVHLIDEPGRPALERAIVELDAAWREDPTFVDAWLSLALAYGRFLARDGLSAAHRAAVLSAALEATDKALTLDAGRSDAWVARAILLEIRSPRELTGVRSAYERALAIDPDDTEAHRRLGRLLTQLGEFERAARHLRSSLFLEPESAQALIDLAELRLAEGDFNAACVVLNAALEADPGSSDAYVLRVLARVPLHEYRAAWTDAETAVRLGSPTQGEAVAVLVDVAAEETGAALARARRLEERPLVRSARSLTVREGQIFSFAFVAVGEHAAALRALNRVAPRGARLWRVMQDERLAPLRGSAGFQALLAAASPFEAQP